MSYFSVSYTDLPASVLECVFSYLKLTDLFQVAKVCTNWQTVINQTRLWFRKIEQLDIDYNIYKDLKSKLIGSQVDQGDVIRLLQGICLYYGCATYSTYPEWGETDGVRKRSKNRLYEDDALNLKSYLGGSAKDMKDDSSWEVFDEDILIASVLLLSRQPSEVRLYLRSDPLSTKGLGVFLLLVSNRTFDISIEDLYSWRNMGNSSDQLLQKLNAFKRCKVKKLTTAVSTIEALPTTLEFLSMSLMVGPTRACTVKDPGLSHLKQRCPQLKYLGVNVRAGMVTKNLPCLPEIQCHTYLYLSQMTQDHLQWAVDTAITLQPSTGYECLNLLSCGLHVEQLCDLVGRLATAGVTMSSRIDNEDDYNEYNSGGGLYVSSKHSYKDMRGLQRATLDTLHCQLFWYQDDDALMRYDENDYIVQRGWFEDFID